MWCRPKMRRSGRAKGMGGGNSCRMRVSPKRVRVRSCASSWSCTWCTGGGPTPVRRAASRAHRGDISPMVRCCGRGWRRAVRPCGNVNAPIPLSTTLGRGRWARSPPFSEKAERIGFLRASEPNTTSPIRLRVWRACRPTGAAWRRVHPGRPPVRGGGTTAVVAGSMIRVARWSPARSPRVPRWPAVHIVVRSHDMMTRMSDQTKEMPGGWWSGQLFLVEDSTRSRTGVFPRTGIVVQAGQGDDLSVPHK